MVVCGVSRDAMKADKLKTITNDPSVFETKAAYSEGIWVKSISDERVHMRHFLETLNYHQMQFPRREEMEEGQFLEEMCVGSSI